MSQLNDIIKGSEYDLSLFTEEQINKLEQAIQKKETPVQKEISAKVQRSFALRSESKKLLQYAKTIVEDAIANHADF